MWKHFLCIMSMLLTLTAWGCSLAPQPVARPVTGQQTLEAVDHWRILAQQIVKEMQLTTGSSVMSQNRIVLLSDEPLRHFSGMR
ncbi:MAG: hypothetical protein ACLU6O_07480 [Bilophila wadsworthia]